MASLGASRLEDGSWLLLNSFLLKLIETVIRCFVNQLYTIFIFFVLLVIETMEVDATLSNVLLCIQTVKCPCFPVPEALTDWNLLMSNLLMSSLGRRS